MMIRMSLLHLGVIVCFITLACSFQSRFFQFGLQRQKFNAPKTLTRADLVQRWGQVARSNVQSLNDLPPTSEATDEQVCVF